MKVDSAPRPYSLLALALAGLVAAGVWQVVIVRGDLRLLTVTAGAAGLVVLCLWRVRLTMVLMAVWLPFSGLVRRLFDQGASPAADPFLLLVPVVSAVLVVFAAWTYRESWFAGLRQSFTTRLVTFLVLVLALEVLNPIQGDPLVGLGGTVFLFFPVLWFFLWRTYCDEALLGRMLSLVAIVGLVCGVYGVYQAVFGFTGFEARWIASREFASLQIGRFIRPFSTFASPEEWSRYLMVAATIGLGRWLGRPARWWWLGLAGVCAVGLVLSGVRVSVFGLLVSSGALLALTARSGMAAAGRLAALAAVLAGYVWFGPAPSRTDDYASDVAWEAFFGHTTRGVLAPFGEDTLWGRFEIWSEVFTKVLPQYPLGMGLGVPTLGAWRFDSSVTISTESYAASVFVAAGLLGGGLLLALFAVVTRLAVRLSLRRAGPDLPVVGAVLIGIVFTSLFANSLSLYAVGPLGWGLMGWLSTYERKGRHAV